MNLIGKEFRTITPIESLSENDVQGGNYVSMLNIYIYIYDFKTVAKYVVDYQPRNPNQIFEGLPKEVLEKRRANLNRNIEKGNDPVSIGKYKISQKNFISMEWSFHEDTKIEFKGEILLNGDALKGVFYKHGEVNVPERVYYNVQKPLPGILINENDINDLS